MAPQNSPSPFLAMDFLLQHWSDSASKMSVLELAQNCLRVRSAPPSKCIGSHSPHSALATSHTAQSSWGIAPVSPLPPKPLDIRTSLNHSSACRSPPHYPSSRRLCLRKTDIAISNRSSTRLGEASK